jgi:hypothetical protein
VGRSAWALGALTVLAFVAILAIGRWQCVALLEMFIDSDIVLKLFDIVLCLAAPLVVIVGLVHLAAGGGARPLLRVIEWAGPIVGLLGLAYGGLIDLIAIQATQVSRFEVVAPSLAEALLPLALGLLVATLAAVFILRKPS